MEHLYSYHERQVKGRECPITESHLHAIIGINPVSHHPNLLPSFEGKRKEWQSNGVCCYEKAGASHLWNPEIG